MEEQKEVVTSTENTKETESENAKDLAKKEKAILFEDGTKISNLKITYKNLFDFQNSYEGAKDLMAALIKKQTFEHEVMVQMIYVGYLGTNPNPKMDYLTFIDNLSFDYERDTVLFNALIKRSSGKN